MRALCLSKQLAAHYILYVPLNYLAQVYLCAHVCCGFDISQPDFILV